MREASSEIHESDEDIEWYLINEVKSNPGIIEQMKDDFIRASSDKHWDWLAVNRETGFLPNHIGNPKELRQNYIEIVMNNLFPDEHWD